MEKSMIIMLRTAALCGAAFVMQKRGFFLF